ncbi:MAG TPA: pseudouridine synthase, partial [Parasegetibacter sp.]
SFMIDEPIMEHPADNGTMVINRKGKPSQTSCEVLEGFGRYSWAKFQIFTGRTHQIRVHMKFAGHPIVCDPLYGDGQPFFLSSVKRNFRLSKFQEEERPLINRLALHSSSLQFRDDNGKEYLLEAPLPKDLKAGLQQLRKLK